MKSFIPRAYAGFFLFFARPAGEYVKQIKVSNTAHLFSMRTNGVSVKPSDRYLCVGLTTVAALRVEIFCDLARRREILFPALWRAQ